MLPRGGAAPTATVEAFDLPARQAGTTGPGRHRGAPVALVDPDVTAGYGRATADAGPVERTGPEFGPATTAGAAHALAHTWK